MYQLCTKSNMLCRIALQMAGQKEADHILVKRHETRMVDPADLTVF